jgi:hypothetical protein
VVLVTLAGSVQWGLACVLVHLLLLLADLLGMELVLQLLLHLLFTALLLFAAALPTLVWVVQGVGLLYSQVVCLPCILAVMQV